MNTQRDSPPQSSGGFFSAVASLLKTNSPRGLSADPVEQVSTLPAAVSGRYLGFCRGDEQQALKLYNEARQLRADYKLDGILERPYEHWEAVSMKTKKALHGRSKEGYPILVETPAAVDPAGLREAGLSRDHIIQHWCYHFEYVFNKLHTADNSQIVLLIDLAGLGFVRLITPDFIATLSKLVSVIGALYPRKTSHYILYNAPSYFETFWNLVSGVLPATARGDCTLCHNIDELAEIIDQSVIPTEYGGEGGPLGQAEEQKQLERHVTALRGTQE